MVCERPFSGGPRRPFLVGVGASLLLLLQLLLGMQLVDDLLLPL